MIYDCRWSNEILHNFFVKYIIFTHMNAIRCYLHLYVNSLVIMNVILLYNIINMSFMSYISFCLRSWRNNSKNYLAFSLDKLIHFLKQWLPPKNYLVWITCCWNHKRRVLWILDASCSLPTWTIEDSLSALVRLRQENFDKDGSSSYPLWRRRFSLPQETPWRTLGTRWSCGSIFYQAMEA